MSAQSLRVGRAGNPLWLWWGLAGLAGVLGGLAIKTAIEVLADIGGFTAVLEAIPPPLFGVLLGAMLGGCTGLAQERVLRGWLPGVRGWAATTLGGWVLFWLLHNSVLPFAHSPWGFVLQGALHGALCGATIGAFQWLALRGRLVGAGRWALVSAASWSAAGASVHFLLDVLLAPANIHGPFDLLLTSVLAALLSGYGLQRLLRPAA